jgi:hypothetical protein
MTYITPGDSKNPCCVAEIPGMLPRAIGYSPARAAAAFARACGESFGTTGPPAYRAITARAAPHGIHEIVVVIAQCPGRPCAGGLGTAMLRIQLSDGLHDVAREGVSSVLHVRMRHHVSPSHA